MEPFMEKSKSRTFTRFLIRILLLFKGIFKRIFKRIFKGSFKRIISSTSGQSRCPPETFSDPKPPTCTTKPMDSRPQRPLRIATATARWLSGQRQCRLCVPTGTARWRLPAQPQCCLCVAASSPSPVDLPWTPKSRRFALTHATSWS